MSQVICGSYASNQFQLFSSTIEFDFSPCFKSILSVAFIIPFLIVLLCAYYYQDEFSNVTAAANAAAAKRAKEEEEKTNLFNDLDRKSLNIKTFKKREAKMGIEIKPDPKKKFQIRFIHAARVVAAALIASLNLLFLFFLVIFPKDSVAYFETLPPNFINPSASVATLSYSVMANAASILTLFISFCRIGDLVSFVLASGWIGIFILDAIRFRSFIYYSLNFSFSSPLIYNLYGVLIAAEVLFIILVGFPIENWRSLPRIPTSSPELHSSFFSRIVFSWVWPFVYKGSKKPLEIDDVYDLNPRMTSSFLIEKFANAWKRQTKRAKESDSSSWFLVKVLFYSFGWEYLSAGLIRIIIIIFTYLSPQLMNLLLLYLQSQTKPADNVPLSMVPPKQSKNVGVSIVVAMIIIMILNIALSAMFTWLCDMATYKARSALMNRVFQKALRLKNPMDPGEVINRFSGDTGAVTGAFAYLHLLWSAPIEIAVCLYLLYGILGPSSFAALGTSIIIGLSSIVVAPMIVRKTKKMLVINDERINLVAGTFSNIQTIKLYGWEWIFGKKIAIKREQQLDKLGNILVVTSTIGGIMSSAVNLIVMSTLALYAFTAPADKPLDLARIFVGMSLLSTLQSPLNTLSGTYSQIMKLGVSYDRLSSLLCAEEVKLGTKISSIRRKSLLKTKLNPDENVLRDMEELKKMNAAILIKDASFAIERPMMPFAMPPGMMPPPMPPNRPLSDQKMTKGDNIPPLLPPPPPGLDLPPGYPLMMQREVILNDINVQVPAGALTAIIGPTGCGKSSLLNVMASSHNFKVKRESKVISVGSTASVSQQPWLFSGTIRENILFYTSFEPKWYSKIINACCLDFDLDSIKGKDMAFLENGGDSLSGGQRQRIALARAVYSLADIYLFDDPFSAVDSRVSAHIFTNIMGPEGLLKGKTRVLATNRIDFLPKCDHIIVMEAGEILAQGTFREITSQSNERVKKMIESIGPVEMPPSSTDSDFQDENEHLRKKMNDLKSYQFLNSPMNQKKLNQKVLNKISSHALLHRTSNAIFDDMDDGSDIMNMEESKKNRIVQDEMQHRGKLPYNLYWYYLRSCSFVFAIIVLLLLLSNLGLGVWNEFWLQSWGQSNINRSESLSKNMYYLGIFTAGTIGATVLSITMDLVAIRVMALNASRKLHHEALISTLISPITFFHSNPAGRIINRFSNDILDLDQTVPSNLLSIMNSLLSALLSIGLACIASYYVVIIAVVMIIMYGFILNFFMKSVRELRRLVLISQSPTFSFLKESLEGVTSIRAFGKEAQCEERMQNLIDTNSKVFYSTFAASSWLATTIQFLSLSMVIPVLFFSVFTGGFVNAGFLAIALSNALSIGSTLQGIVQAYIAMEISLVSIERIKEYIDLPTEEEYRNLPTLQVPGSDWPTKGEIEFKDFSTGYRMEDKDELVLKNINLTINPGSKVAVVGRTGSGKSTLVLSLFQLLGAKSGSIIIDGIDISTIDLMTLRKRMAIIPQASMIFPGTVRENLDPTKKIPGKDLMKALEMVGLDQLVESLVPPEMKKKMNPLDCRVPSERLSMGERQLFCFCRAVLKKSKIVLLDEPTANIDVETDNMMQDMIRKIFADSTVITIAHRLSTILDYDMVICLENGAVAEYGNPQDLLQDSQSMFSALYNASLSK